MSPLITLQGAAALWIAFKTDVDKPQGKIVHRLRASRPKMVDSLGLQDLETIVAIRSIFCHIHAYDLNLF